MSVSMSTVISDHFFPSISDFHLQLNSKFGYPASFCEVIMPFSSIKINQYQIIFLSHMVSLLRRKFNPFKLDLGLSRNVMTFRARQTRLPFFTIFGTKRQLLPSFKPTFYQYVNCYQTLTVAIPGAAFPSPISS